MPESRWYRIEAKAGDVAKVYLFDEIGYFGVSAGDFVRELKDVTAGTIELHVNSPGGDAFDGFAILNALRQHPARVVAVVDGLAASAASYIAVGADEVVMSRNSEMMVHDASGVAVGPASEMQKMADELEHFSNNIASIYAERAGGTVADWRKVMQAETWYSAEEAVEAGLADRVDLAEQAKPKASARRLIFNYAGRAEAPAPTIPRQVPPEGDDVNDVMLDALRQKLGVAEDLDEAGILAALDEALSEVADPPPADDALPAEVTAQLLELAELKVERFTARRDAALLDAVKSGRITPGERGGWVARWDAAPEATAAALQALPTGSRVPLQELGYVGDDESGMSLRDAAYLAMFPDEKKVTN